MNRMTRWDPVCHCYKAVREQEMGRSVIQELGVYESIHEKEIEKAVNIGDIRDMYFTGAAQLDPYWENFGKEKNAPSSWIPVTKELPKLWDSVLITYSGQYKAIIAEKAVGIGSLDAENGWYFEEIEGYTDRFRVSAWQPLPDAYEGE